MLKAFSDVVVAMFSFLPHQAPLIVDTFSFPEPHVADIKSRKKLWATEYHIHQANNATNGYALLDKHGNSLGVKLSYDDWCDAALEGTVGVRIDATHWKVFNYDTTGTTSQVDCSKKYPRLPSNIVKAMGRSRFVVPQGEYGNGYGGLILNPYRSVAVDLTVFPLNKILYIPAAKGVKIVTPAGDEIIHDGYFYTADKGGAIKGNHIDVFIGLSEKNPFPFIKSTSSGTFDAQIIENPEIQYQFSRMHTP